MLIPLRGLLHGRVQTFKWVTLFVWLYFFYGVWNIVNESQRPLGVLQIITSLAMFIFCVMYIRSHDATE